MPPQERGDFDPHAKTKSIPFLTLTSSQIRSPPYLKWILMPSHSKQVNFDSCTKTNSTRIPTLKPSQFRCLHCNQVIFDPPRKRSQFRYQQKKQVEFDPSHKESIHFDATTEIKSIRSTLKNTVTFDVFTQKQDNFDPLTETKLFLNHKQKRSQYRSLH